jgi:hypothetical protein
MARAHLLITAHTYLWVSKTIHATNIETNILQLLLISLNQYSTNTSILPFGSSFLYRVNRKKMVQFPEDRFGKTNLEQKKSKIFDLLKPKLYKNWTVTMNDYS